MTTLLSTARATAARRRPGRLLKRIALRAVAALATVFGAATLAFFALNLLSSDPVRTVIGLRGATPELIAQVRLDLRLDHPLFERYLLYLADLARGDLGTSYQLKRPVSDLILEQLGPTLMLALTAMILALVIAVVATALTATGPQRHTASVFELVILSTPSFWVGLVLISVFSFQLGWFPLLDDNPYSLGALVLPAVTLALPIAATLAQVLRGGILEAIEQPFSITARARGIGKTRLLLVHALRHAAIPVVSLAGWIAGSLLGGAVLIETVFGRQGIGRLAATSIQSADVPVVTGVVLFSALIFVVVNSIVDVLYAVIDPRIEAAP